MNEPIEKYEQGTCLLIKKPIDWTSFDLVRKIRSILKIKKIGHAGTLDPLATGLMIICTGKATKQIDNYIKLPKEYTGIFTIGATTISFDLETAPENFKPYQLITTAQINEAALILKNSTTQIPPMFSAIKKNGNPLYKLARQGIEIERPPRLINITEFIIEKIELPNIYFKIHCSSGTYIRTIANDFGHLLQVGAYLSKLERTKIGDFTLENAISIKEFEFSKHNPFFIEKNTL
ncbi:MAG: tRNA pseudouridine(55) synthase TruB [Sediminibacterium sp.]|nr:tRNA pseudouridine(55) synthase TruB [Sediminibacterium sp.]